MFGMQYTAAGDALIDDYLQPVIHRNFSSYFLSEKCI